MGAYNSRKQSVNVKGFNPLSVSEKDQTRAAA